MKRFIMISLFVCVFLSGFTQDIFMTRTGQITFFSKTPIENIEAVNNEVNGIINTSTGELVFAVLIKSFRFEKALMEEHFNENYMESSKIPKALFQGKLTNLKAVDFKKNGTYDALVEGDLTIHGVKRHVTATGKITVEEGKLKVQSGFSVLLKDFDIERPALVAEKIADKIDVNLNCQYERKG